MLRWARNFDVLSVFAVDGGFPTGLAGASAHQVSPVPSDRRTATLPCGASSSV